MKRLLALLLLAAAPCAPSWAETPADARASVDALVASHPGETGAYVLDNGEEALLARAWLSDQARASIDVQYFIWSTDNVGILASESILRAAERGVRVRIIVDDLLIDAPDKSLLALAKHPNIDIRIYNPVHSVGVPLQKRVLNLATDFRGANQRMHDKTFIVDGRYAITGGRNMADEYYDFDQEYNFRDRDAFVLGAVVPQISENFERFWKSELCAPVEELYDGLGIMQKQVTADDAQVQAVYRKLHAYAASTKNFAPEVRSAIESMPARFSAIAKQLSWGRVDFVSDRPGKNDSRFGLGGGGLTTAALGALLDSAQSDVVIQSPYLVLSDPALALLKRVRSRGVRVRISTNSLASTDNLQAFSGYRSQRSELLKLGLEIFEFRPDPKIQRTLMQRHAAQRTEVPIFALHAKTMVIDNRAVYIGTYNLDPRSENLNTEVGVVIHDAHQASTVAAAIVADMLPGNSWNAANDDPDQFASFAKRSQVRFWQLLPIKPLL